jgi:cyclin-dependent kinase-like
MMGKLIPDHMEIFVTNPRFIGLKFPEITNPETLERRYVGIFPKKALSLMKGLLEMDPYKRLTAEEAIRHPYFEELRS